MEENLQKLDPIFYQGASGICYYLTSALLALRIVLITTPTSVTITNSITMSVTQTVTKTVTQAITSTTTKTLTVTQLITTTVTVAQPPKTYTITNTKIVTSTVPESTLTITEKPLFSEDLVALAISVAMIVTSTAIGLKLRKKWYYFACIYLFNYWLYLCCEDLYLLSSFCILRCLGLPILMR